MHCHCLCSPTHLLDLVIVPACTIFELSWSRNHDYMILMWVNEWKGSEGKSNAPFCRSGGTSVREKSCSLKTSVGRSVWISTPLKSCFPHFTFTTAGWVDVLLREVSSAPFMSSTRGNLVNEWNSISAWKMREILFIYSFFHCEDRLHYFPAIPTRTLPNEGRILSTVFPARVQILKSSL